MKVGLARVSSVGQTLKDRLLLLKNMVAKRYLRRSNQAQKQKTEKVYREWIDFMRDGDQAVCTRLDRATRSIYDLQVLIRELESKGVTFAATEQSIDTKTPEGKCFLNMLSVFSEFEVGIRKSRQMSGIKANLHKFKGRGQTIDVERIKTLKNEGKGATAIAKEMGIDRTSVYRLLQNC